MIVSWPLKIYVETLSTPLCQLQNVRNIETESVFFVKKSSAYFLLVVELRTWSKPLSYALLNCHPPS